MDARKNLYAIYATADDKLASKLLGRLKSIEKDSNITIWDNDPIHKDQAWKPQKDSRIDKADFFLLLLSKNFMYSEFIKQLEFKNIIDRHKEGKSTVIPILLEDCPWEIDFEADDYTFNFNELQVLPEDRNPVKNWKSEDEALQQVFIKLKLDITGEALDESDTAEEPELSNSELEDQLALNFAKEAEAKRLAKEEKTRKKLEVDASLKAEKEQRLLEKAAAEAKVKEEERLQKEAETKRLGEEEKLRQEAEQQRRLEEENRLREQEAEEASYHESDETVDQEANSGNKKRILAGLLAGAFVIAAIVTFSGSGDASEEEQLSIPKDVEVKGPVAPEKDQAEIPKKEESLTLLTIGEIYEDGFVFEISDDGKNGKIAHTDDAGPMPWQDAMIIHDQLGPGWRLPTFDELVLMQKTIGQGAENSGEFANGLYWSATPYDDYQARLLRFRDGNTSYHYNSGGDHRKFLVRAIRDFSR